MARTKIDDFAGRRFGRWSVLGRAENNRHGHARWNCICDCGTARKVSHQNLRVGDSKSCGCRAIGASAPNFIDMTGKRCGRLSVIEGAGTNAQNAAIWLCVCDCGNTSIVGGTQLRSGHTKSCGCLSEELKRARCGPLAPGWKGGKYKHGNGYIIVTLPGGARALEHRLVMEEVLGRKLTNEEEVHHKNGVRGDNDPSNLELWSGSHPPGQRVVDLLEWAHEIIEKYEG